MLSNNIDPIYVTIPLRRKSGDILPNGKVFKNDNFAKLIKDKVVCKAREDMGLHESEYQDIYDSVIGVVCMIVDTETDPDDTRTRVGVSLYNTLEFYKCKNPEINIIGRCIETDDTVELVEIQRLELWDNTVNLIVPQPYEDKPRTKYSRSAIVGVLREEPNQNNRV